MVIRHATQPGYVPTIVRVIELCKRTVSVVCCGWMGRWVVIRCVPTIVRVQANRECGVLWMAGWVSGGAAACVIELCKRTLSVVWCVVDG